MTRVLMPMFFSPGATVPQSGYVVGTEPDGWLRVWLADGNVVLRSPRQVEDYDSGIRRWLDRNLLGRDR